MASRAGDSSRVSSFEKLLSNILHKDELSEIPTFYKNADIEQHLRRFENKIEEMNLSAKEKINFLLKSLHDDIAYELKAQKEYPNNINNYEWIKEKLTNLFRTKESKVSHIIGLLNIRQSERQNLRDFLSAVRIEGVKTLIAENPDRREELMVMAFINGLNNKNYKTALKEIKPKSLDEAYALIKNEKEIGQITCPLRSLNAPNMPAVSSQEQTISMLRQELNSLKNRIYILEQERQFQKLSYADMSKRTTNYSQDKTPQKYSSMPLRSNNYTLPDNRINRPSNGNVVARNEVKCYRCNEIGHIARYCNFQQKVCQNCRKPGHNTENCYSSNYIRRPTRENNFRKFSYDDFDDQVSEPNTEDLLGYSDSLVNGDINDDNAQIPTISSIQKFSKNTNKYPSEILAWEKYINGQGKRPQKPKYQKTVISTSNAETAANKPVVKCSVYKTPTSVLFDTGAESNVVDSFFLQQLRKRNERIPFMKQGGHLTCANGSPIQILGYTYLPIDIGGVEVSVKLTVVEKMFPKIIFGLKSMKKEFIDIVPSHDCIVIKGYTHVSFISKTDSEN